MKKSKLIMSIITCCFALSVLAFGVYASLSVNFNLSGKISFDPNGVDATITTQVFKYKENIAQDDAYLKACDLQGKTFEELANVDDGGYEKLTEKKEYKTKVENTYYPNLEQDLSGSVLNFEDCNAYFIVVHVLPNSTYDLEQHNQIVFVELTQQDLHLPNVWLAYNDKYLVIYPSAQQDGGLSMVFFIGITEPFIQVPEQEFSLNLSFEYKDIFVPSDPEVQVYVGEDYVTLWITDEEIETLTELVVPEKVNGNILTEFSQDSDNFNGLEILIFGQNIDFDYTVVRLTKFCVIDQRNVNHSSLDGFLYNKDKSILENGINQESVEIKSFVKTIDVFAFHMCSLLTDITFPDGLLSIKQMAFDETNLSSVYIPASVQTIGSDAFNYMENPDFKIYCEIEDKPAGWHNDWKGGKYSDDYPVEWGVTREDYLKAIGQ